LGISIVFTFLSCSFIGNLGLKIVLIIACRAGVTGLTTALLLTRKSEDYNITIVAKHLPGDTDLEYTSPWAAANFVPIGETEDSKEGVWEKATWKELYRLAQEVPEAGVHIQGLLALRLKKELDF
jgi:D-amino-acid oxidase